MIRTLSLGLVFAAVLAIGAAYASALLQDGGAPWAPWSMALGTTVLMVATTALGAARNGRLGRLWLPLGFVLLVVGGGFGVVLAAPAAESPSMDLWLGLPPRAVIVLFGVGLLPLLAVPLAYALTFDEMTLSEADLARVRAARSASHPGAPPSADPGRVAAGGRVGAGVEVEV